jgi:hypothetical protein
MIDRFLDITSIDPIYWGKCGWIFLNSIALTYKPEYKDKYKQFILQLPYILPCKSCGENLHNNISTMDDALKSKEHFLAWLAKIRNEIYKEQSRPEKNIIENINEIFSVNQNTNNYSILMIILSVIILIILIIVLKVAKSS